MSINQRMSSQSSDNSEWGDPFESDYSEDIEPFSPPWSTQVSNAYEVLSTNQIIDSDYFSSDNYNLTRNKLESVTKRKYYNQNSQENLLNKKDFFIERVLLTTGFF